jgi:prepilin-type processing-associated H-X9-DG protein
MKSALERWTRKRAADGRPHRDTLRFLAVHKRRRIMFRKAFVYLLAFSLFVPAVTLGAESLELASRIPGDAVAAVFIKDLPGMVRGKAWMSSLSQVFVGEVAFALLDVPDGQEMPPCLLTGKVDAEKFQSFLDVRLQPILRRNLGDISFTTSDGIRQIVVNGSPVAFYTVKDAVLSLSLSKEVVVGLSSGAIPAEKSLQGNPLFAKVISRTPPRSRLLSFVNQKRIFEALADQMPDEARFALKGLGLLDIEAWGGSTTIVDDTDRGSLTFISSGELGGFLTLARHPVEAAVTAQFIPDDYSLYARLHFSSALDVWEQIQKPLGDLTEGKAREKNAEFEETFRAETGLDFRKDLLGSLGGEIAVAAAVPETLRIPDAVLLVEVTNPKKIQDLLAKMVPTEATGADYKGVSIGSIPLPMLEAAYAFLDGCLIVATDVSVLKAVIDAKKEGMSLEKRQWYQAANGAMGKGSHMLYLDAGSAAPILFSVMSRAANRSGGFGEPSPSKWELVGKLLAAPLLTDAVVALGISGNNDSVTLRGFSTIGGTTKFAAGSALMAGIMLPAFSTAKSRAQDAVCMNNLKQLAVAQLMYAQDHDGNFAEKLSDLYPDYVSSFEVFRCASEGGPPILDKEDIDLSSSYILRKGLTRDSAATEVLIYELPGSHRDGGGNAAFIDGHVEQLSFDQLEQIMQKDEE